MTDKTSVDDIIGIVKTEEPTNSVQLKKEAQLSICEKRVRELEKENKQLKQQLADIDSLIYDLGHDEMRRQYEEIIKGDVQ